jgi:hypothetical protein
LEFKYYLGIILGHIHILGFREGELPMKYLGVPLLSSRIYEILGFKYYLEQDCFVETHLEPVQ